MKYRLIVYILLLSISFLLLPRPAAAYIKSFQMDDEGHNEINLELDPYYSNIAFIHALTSTPIPKVELEQERGMYAHMLTNFYLPRFMLVEGSVYPLPIAGVMIKKYARDFYDSSQVSPSLNLTRAITAGFPEPYAVSLFLGNVIDFVVPREEETCTREEKKEEGKKVVGNGYAGFLTSYGNYHIADNVLVWDHWMEYEFKIKGSDIRKRHCLSWSYAIGTKLHRNEEIKDAVYLSIKRSRIDYVDQDINPVWKFFFRNSEQEFRLDFDLNKVHKGKIIRYFFLMGKNFPLFKNKLTLSISTGFMHTVSDAYSGSLASKIRSSWDVLIRPNFQIKWD